MVAEFVSRFGCIGWLERKVEKLRRNWKTNGPRTELFKEYISSSG